MLNIWNTHNIIIIAGAFDHLCKFDEDHDVLDYIVHNDVCKETPMFYPPEFQAVADAFLYEHLYMTPTDITWSNVKFVYVFLSNILKM